MENNSKELQVSLIDEVASDNIKDLGEEYSELVLDSFLDNDSIKDIPFFGTLAKVYKGVVSIRDNIFAKKVYKFLFQLKDVSPEKKEKFLNKISTNFEHKKKVGETLLVLLERIDDIDKPTLVGNLFKASIEEKIDYEDFLRLSTIISKAFLPDLYRLKSMVEQKVKIPDHVLEELSNIGLVNWSLKERKKRLGLRGISDMRLAIGVNKNKEYHGLPSINYTVNQFGEMLVEFAFEQS